ncbi:MAG: T9SS type A sorting domain-containing protein [Bacteroidetes bacterium]|nr:MAG: T9SS type A sorting domain-containing protein [Bacteroidota bacterium]
MEKQLPVSLFAIFIFLGCSGLFAQSADPKKGGDNSALATLDSTNLPIVFINTNFQAIVDEPKITAGMAIIDKGYNLMNHITDTNFTYYGNVGIEQRGSISQQWWWTQKSYAVETHDLLGNDTDAVIIGMPKENDWVLYGPFNESTLMRNVLSYQLARELGYWAPRTKYCEMMLKTGFTWKYNGVYVMTEKIKRGKNRVDISKLDMDDNAGDSLSGGYIVAVDQNINASDSGWFSKHPQSANLFFTYKYPKGDIITVQQKTYIQAYVDSFENALSGVNFSNPVTGFRKFIEPFTFMDFFFIQEMSKNIDAYKRSSYLYKDKFSDGGKLNANPHWDYNSAWEVKLGGCEPFAADTGWTYPLTCWIHGTNYPVPFWWKRLLQDTLYVRDMKCRWTQLRSTTLSTANIYHIMDSVANYVSPASTRHYSQFNLTLNYQTEVNNLKTWIGKRLAWMDANMPGNCWNTGTSESSRFENSVSVYPNPSFGKYNVQSLISKIQKIEVSDIFGRHIQSLPVKGEVAAIDISSHPRGVYFLKCYLDAGSLSLKVVKID